MNLICDVIDSDPFTKGLIISFIKKTAGLKLKSDEHLHTDVLFADAALDGKEIVHRPYTQLVVISANENFVKSFFQGDITDFLYKPELSYDRFKQTVKKIEHLNALKIKDQ